MLIKGIYQFGEKRISCRNDYCTVCRAERLVEGQRNVAVLHLFWVPVLPFALTTRWVCTTCRQDPAKQAPQPMAVIVFISLFAVLALFGGIVALVRGKEEPGFCWFLVALGAAGLVFAWAKSREDRPGYQAAREAVTPLAGNFCPFCRVRLLGGPKRSCHVCGITVLIDVGTPRRRSRGIPPPLSTASPSEPPPLPKRE